MRTARVRQKTIFRNETGAVAVEFALVFGFLLLLSLGFIEFGVALLQWNRAEKALQMGARLAVVRDPVATDLINFDGKTGSNSFGDACMDPVTGVIQAGCIYAPNPVVCNSTGCSGYSYSATDFNNIVTEMQAISPNIQPGNVTIEYEASGLGFVGRPASQPGLFNLSPLVTVKVNNLIFDFIAIDVLFGFQNLTMPPFSATLTGEDMSTVTN
jgi:hypothetical protein